VWIYGGGLDAGSAADPQYNLSGIAHVGQDIGKPIIAGNTRILNTSIMTEILISINKLPAWSVGFSPNATTVSRRKLKRWTT
jgi:hypothetical protein